jgi:hypothetical protein
MWNNRKYVIIEASEVSNIDFSKILQNPADILLYNNDKSKSLVKYEGDQPSFLDGKTEYTYDEILIELAKDSWQ